MICRCGWSRAAVAERLVPALALLLALLCGGGANALESGQALPGVRVEELGAGSCRVHWSATADAQGISGEQAAEILSGVYGQMLGWVADALAKG